MSIYKDDISELEQRLIKKDKELDSKVEESKRMQDEKNSIQVKLNELRKKIMFTKEWLRFENDAELLKAWATNGKAFSTRSYHTPSPVKKLKEIAVRKGFNCAVSSKIERNLLKFLLYLENKGVPVISIYKDEFLKIREKKMIAQLDSQISKMEWELFNEDTDIFINDDDYDHGFDFDYNELQNNKKPLLGRKSKSSMKVTRELSEKENSKANHIPRNSSEKLKNQRTLSNISGSSNNRDSSNGRASFHSDDSFRPIWNGPPLIPEKPSWVPVLDLKNVMSYWDSDDDRIDIAKHLNLAVPDYSHLPLYQGLIQIQNQL